MLRGCEQKGIGTPIRRQGQVGIASIEKGSLQGAAAAIESRKESRFTRLAETLASVGPASVSAIPQSETSDLNYTNPYDGECAPACVSSCVPVCVGLCLFS